MLIKIFTHYYCNSSHMQKKKYHVIYLCVENVILFDKIVSTTPVYQKKNRRESRILPCIIMRELLKIDKVIACGNRFK